MTTPAVDPADEQHPAIVRLRARVAELEQELVAQQRLNFELNAASEASRNFRASRDAGHVIDLDHWEPS